MSWGVKVKRINQIQPIEGADKIEVAFIGGWPSVIPKGMFVEDELIVFIPQDAIVPAGLLEQLGLSGKLAGKDKNRVKAIKLRKQLSVGIVMKAEPDMVEDQDVTEYYNIIRYEEPIPVQLSGKVRPRPETFIKFDVDNINDNLNLFFEGESICCSIKLHGTNSAYGLVNDQFCVCSRNLALEEDESNLYWRMAKKYNIEEKLRHLWSILDKKPLVSLWLHAEIFGPGVQDLTYGLTEPELRAFDLRIDNDDWFDVDDFYKYCSLVEIPTVPILYGGPYSLDKVREVARGNEKFSGKDLHVNEGCVVRSTVDRRICKVVNEDYLLRKDGTEYH